MITSILIKQLFKKLEQIKVGNLTLTTPEGKIYHFGDSSSFPKADLTVHNWKCLAPALLRGDIGVGETYIEGLWDSSSIDNLFQLFLTNANIIESYGHGNLLNRMWFNVLNTIIRKNSRAGSKRNIQAHYDVSNDFYKLWLDPTMTYSSAIYSQPELSLQQAQDAKYQRIVSKINGGNVLEIGCGWGGFAKQSIEAGHHYKGLTISEAQHDYVKECFGDAADIQLRDYRASDGLYDSIVSIEMFEAVGERYWQNFFQTLQQRLRKGGNAIIQTITIRDDEFEGYRTRSDFIRHYTFPGGMLPSRARFQEEAKLAGLRCKEIFSFGQDYARTLREWSSRFEAARSDIGNLGFDESFVRSWRFYLAICAAAFAVGRTDVAQIELYHA